MQSHSIYITHSVLTFGCGHWSSFPIIISVFIQLSLCVIATAQNRVAGFVGRRISLTVQICDLGHSALFIPDVAFSILPGSVGCGLSLFVMVCDFHDSSVIGQNPLLTAVSSTVFDGFSAFVQKLQSSYPPLFVIDTLIAMVTAGTANGVSLNIKVAVPQNFSFRRCCPVYLGIAGGDADRLTDCIQIAEFHCVFLIGISHRTEAGCPSNWIPVNILILL